MRTIHTFQPTQPTNEAPPRVQSAASYCLARRMLGVAIFLVVAGGLVFFSFVGLAVFAGY